jgi:hypothetical protein
MSGSYPGDPQSAQQWRRPVVDPSLPLIPQDAYNGYPAPTVMGQPAPALAPSAPNRQGDNFAISSLVLGIVSVSLGWLPVCGIVALAPAIIGTVLGCLGLRSAQRRALAIAGIILSLVGLALAVIIVL